MTMGALQWNTPVTQQSILGKWQLQEIPNTPRNSQTFYRQFTLDIEPNSIRGVAFNHFSSETTLGVNSIRVASRFSTTRKRVMGERSTMEKIYFSRLIHANQWQVVGQQLTVSGSEGQLVFQRQL